MFWLLLVIAFSTLILGELLRPKIQDNSKPSSLKDFNIPTADETRAVPVVFGTVLMDGPNVIWYGDLKTVKLTKKVRTGFFSTQRLTLAFRYSIGIWFGLCHGPVDALLEVRTGSANSKIAFTGNVTATSGDDGEEFTVDARTIFGGDSEDQLQASGTGGVYAVCTFYKGSGTQNSNSYLANILSTQVPAHRNICHVVWQGPSSGKLVYNYDLGNPTIAFTREPFLSGYVGTSPNLNPIAFVIKRLPNMLSGSLDTYYNINSGDANPADVMYEIITNDEFGMGLSTGLIDTNSFKKAQITLYNEGLGFSSIWDSPKQVTEILEEILKYVDGTIYVDISTGLVTLKLARDDYDKNNILILDEDSVVEVTDFARSSWDETTNEVVVSYLDRFQKYQNKTATAQDIANARIQDSIVSSRVSYAGISNQTVASKIAYRDLRQLTIPLAKCTVKCNRKAITLRPGDVFKLVWPDYNITEVIFRVVKIDYGELTNGIIQIEVVQDVFSLVSSAYGLADTSRWTDPVGGPQVATTLAAYESPYFYSQDSIKIQIVAAQPDKDQLAFNSYTAVGSLTGTYTQVDSGDSYTPTGTLDSSYGAITNDVDTSGTITINPSNPDNLIFLQNFSSDKIKTGENLFLITDGIDFEIMAFESVTTSSGKYILHNIWRGLLDTVPRAWSAGARAWFFSYSDAISSQTYSSGDTVYAKIASISAKGNSDLSNASTLTIQQRSLKPYPPGYFRINGSTSTVNITNGSDIVIAWEPRNRVAQGEKVVKQFDTGYTAEARTEYYLKFFNATNVLLRTVGPLTTLTYTYTNANQVTDNSGTEPKVVSVQLYSKRDGLFSLYPQQRTLLRPTGVAPTNPTYNPGTNTYTAPLPDDAVSINGIKVCTSTPINGQVLSYNSTNNCWEPATISVTLAGDVTGPSNSNTVVKLQNRNISSTAPSTNQFLGWNSSSNQWEPRFIASGTSGSVATTSYSTTPETHTTDNTWEDISDLNVAYTPPELSNLYCVSTIEVAGISNNLEKVSFRFLLDGTTASETWSIDKSTVPQNDERHLLTIHTVFENVTANNSHAIKVQWNDGGSGLDVTILDRRITVVTCKSPFDINFIPSNVSGLQYWFEASSLNGFNNNDPVTTMTDSSGNSHDFTAGTSPDTRGLYKTNQVNGLAALQFNHDGNGATTTNTMYSGTNWLSGFTEGEIFVLIRSTNSPASSNLVGNYSTFGSDTSNVQHYPFNTSATVYDGWGSTARKNTGIPSVNVSSWHVYNVSSKSGNWTSRFDGTQHFTTSTNTVAWTTSPKFGGNSTQSFGAGFSGQIAAVLIYNRVLNSSERSAVRTYFANKYNV